LTCFDEPFDLIVRGSVDGPLPGQIDAVRRILSDADGLKVQATTPMVEMFADCDLPTPALGMPHDRIWALLSPAFIEVADESYYSDGRIAVLIAFQSLQEPSFVPAIETANGRFEEVLSGT